jgi:teichuronic acid biosynthesis glycosyltransferase TuaC
LRERNGVMRVLVVTNMFLSGNGNWVAEQVRSLRAEGLQVDVLFFDTKRTRLFYGTSLPRVIRAVGSGKYDIIHTHHTYTMFQVEMARRFARDRVPVVLTNHEAEILDREGRARTWHPTSRLRHSLGVKRLAARKADFVIFVARQLASVLGFDGRHEIIPCGVDLEKFRPLDRRECRRNLGIPDDAMVIFFPANPSNGRKRFTLAREAFAIVRSEVPHALMLTGGGIAADEMPYYYNAADVVLQTSFSEASPTVVKEALGCEVPVVSTDAGDTREVIHNVPNCALSTESPFEIAKSLLAARGRHAEGAREHLIARELDLPRVARRIIRIYEQVVLH